MKYFEILQSQISFFGDCKNDAINLPFPVQKIEEVYGGGFNFIIAKKYTSQALIYAKNNNIEKY